MNGTANSPELPLPAPRIEQGNNFPEKSGSVENKITEGGVTQGPITALPIVDPTQYADPAAQATPTQLSDDQNQKTTDEDVDVIEKEWVNRAKKIVDSTKDNPAKQSRELSVFKAEYMKKRFNKELKIKEEAADQA